MFSALYFPIIVSRAVGGLASLTTRCWRLCVQEAQVIFAVPSTASSFPPFQVSGKASHLTAPHKRSTTVYITVTQNKYCFPVSRFDLKEQRLLHCNFPDTSLEKGGWRMKKDGPSSLSKAAFKTNQRKKKSKQSKEQAIGGKDASLFLFRALGKILHCKRESPLSTQAFSQFCSFYFFCKENTSVCSE